MAVRWAAVACALAGCGRFAFDARTSDAAGSASGDAQPGDALPGDASDAVVSPDAFSQTAACAGFALCDSFEDPNFHAVWTIGNRVSLDTTHAHRGLQSAHFHDNVLSSGQTGYSQLVEDQTLAAAVPPATFYLRGWFYLGSLPAGTNRMEMVSIEPATSGNTTGDYVFAFSNDTVVYTQADGKTVSAATPPPVNQWFCIAAKLTRGIAKDGELSFTSDSLPAVTSTGVTTDSTTTPIKRVAVGIGFAGNNVFQNQPAIDMWVDDVIVDTQPITCAD